jgi:hypothetical protein
VWSVITCSFDTDGVLIVDVSSTNAMFNGFGTNSGEFAGDGGKTIDGVRVWDFCGREG